MQSLIKNRGKKMYTSFAENYDLLMHDVEYKERTEYLLSVFEKYSKKPTLMLDLACGTGSFSNEFAKRGIQVIGVDISPEMLNIAREKSERERQDVLYLCQDAAELDLYGTVDGVVCCMDSINHITDASVLAEAFKKVSLFLEPDCLFVFDVNTPYKHKEILGNNTFVLEEDNVYCVWQNEYIEEEALTEITLDFFRRQDNGLYDKSEQFIEERAYTIKELTKLLEDAGFRVLDIFDDMSFEPLKNDSERAVFIAKKVF